MSKKKGCLVGALSFIIPIILLWGGIQYRINYAKTEILTSSSDTDPYSLKIYTIGEPEWPFGASHCRFDLFYSTKRITKHAFAVHDDGSPAYEGNFHIIWSANNVTITVSGSEQKDHKYVLYFDGTVE